MPIRRPKSKRVSANLPIASGKPVMGVPLDEESPKERVELLLASAAKSPDYEGFDAEIVRNHLHVVSATILPTPNTARALFAFTVAPNMCNRMSNLHGGCQALLFDMCTTAALAPIAKRGYWQFAGVSRTLNVTYLRPAPVGVEVEIETEVVHAGKRLATIKGVMRRKDDGAVISVCEHGKASIDPEPGKAKL